MQEAMQENLVHKRFCPVCGELSVKWLRGGNLGDMYQCASCGYQGIVFEGTDEFIKEFKKNLDKESRGC